MSNITNGKKMAIIKLFLNLRTIQKERSEKHNWKEITVGDNSFLQQGGIQEKKINADRKYYYNVITEEIKYERPEIMKTTYQEYESIERITETQIISFIENLNFDELKAISKTIEDEIDQLENTTKKEKKFVEQLKTLKRALQAEEREEQRIREISQTQDDDSGKEKEKPTTIYFQKSNNKIGINRKLKPGDVWESLSFNIFHEKKWQKVFIEPLSKTAVKMVNEGHIRLRNKKAISNELDIDREIKSNLQIVQQKMYKLNTQTKDGARRLQNIRAIIWAEMQRILKPGAKIKLGKGTERDISNKVAELLGGWHWELFKKQNRFKKQELLQLKRMINVVNPELLIDKDARTQDILEIEKGFQISMTEVADDRHRGRPRTTTRVEMDPPIDLGKIRTTILSNPKSSASNSTSKILNEEELFERNFKKANLRVDMTFPYFDAQTSEFEEYVTILGREYNTEAKEWNVQLETIYGILKRRIYKVVEGMREGKRIEQERVEFMEAVERYELSKGQRFPLVDDSGRLIRKGKVIGFGWFEGRWGVDVQDEDNPKVGVLNKKPRKMNNSRKEGMKKHFSPLLANALITDSGQIPETFPFAYNSDHYENEAKVVDFEFKDSMSQIVLAKKNGKNFYRGTLDNVIKGIDDGRTERRRRDNVSGQGTKKNPYTLSDDEYDNVSGQGTKNNPYTLSEDEYDNVSGQGTENNPYTLSDDESDNVSGQGTKNNPYTLSEDEYDNVSEDEYDNVSGQGTKKNPYTLSEDEYDNVSGQGTKNNPYTLSDDEYDNVSGQGTENNPYTLSDDESDNVSGQGTKNNPYTLSEDEYDNVSEDEYDNVSGQGTKKNPYTLSEDEYDNVSGQGTKNNPYTLSDDEYDNVSGQGTKNNAITDLEQLVGFNPVGKFIDVSVHAVGGLIGQAAPNIQTITAIEYAGVQDDNKHKFKIFTQSRPNPGNIINQDFTYTTEETVRRVKWGTQFRRGQGTKNNPYTLSDDEYDNVSGQGTKNNPYTLSDDESDNVSGQGTKNNPYTLSEDEYDNVSEDEYDNVSEDEYDNVSGQGTKKNPYTLSEDEYDNVSGQGTKNNPYTLSEDEYDNVSEDEYDNVSGQGTRNNPYTLSEDEYDNVSEDESDNVSGQGTKKNPYTLSEDESDNVSPVSGRIAYDDDYVEDITDQELQRRQDQRDERIANAPYVSGSDGDGANPIEHSYNDIAPNVPLLTDDDDYVEDITDQELQRRQAQRDERIANETVDLVSEDGNVLDQFYRNIQGQGLQALTFEKPATNKKFIMYIGRLTRFRGKTGVISYRRLVKYKKPKRPFFVQWLTEEHKTRIQFKVTWDNAQLRDSEKSQFNKEEFDYLMAHLKDEMKEIDEYSIERSYSENQLIPIDELNFQKEMYNKDTSTLVVAEASASKPGLSPASIPSGELSAMLAELSSMDNTESEYASQSEYASESEVEEPLETGWKSDDFASSDFASESGDNSSELSN